MIALLDNMQILVISKKLVNKLHSVGLVTSLWLGVTQRITNEISNFVTCSNNPIHAKTAYSCKKKCARPSKAELTATKSNDIIMRPCARCASCKINIS